MITGQTLRITSVDGNTVTFEAGGSECRYILEPFLRGHEAHAPVKPGDVLAAIRNSTPGDSTLVQAPCGCQALLDQTETLPTAGQSIVTVTNYRGFRIDVVAQLVGDGWNTGVGTLARIGG